MKRVLILVAVILLLAGCDMSHTNSLETSDQSQKETTTEVTTTIKKEVVLVDQDGIKITCSGMSLINYLPEQPEAIALYVHLTIENNSANNITVYPKDSSVNGVMKLAGAAMPFAVLSGKKLVSSFFFGNLEGTGITSVDQLDQVKEVEFRLWVVNTDTHKDLFETELLKVAPQT